MSLDTRTQHHRSSPSPAAFVFLSFPIYTESLPVGGRFRSSAPVVSVKNEENWTEVYTVLSTTPTVAAHFFLADSPSPSSRASRLLIIVERRIMGNDCLSTVLTVVADQG